MKGRKPQTLNSASRRSSQHRLAVLGLFFFFFKGPLPDPALCKGFIKILIEFLLGTRWARGTHPVARKSPPRSPPFAQLPQPSRCRRLRAPGPAGSGPAAGGEHGTAAGTRGEETGRGSAEPRGED